MDSSGASPPTDDAVPGEAETEAGGDGEATDLPAAEVRGRASRALHRVTGEVPDTDVSEEHRGVSDELRADLFGPDSWLGVLLLTMGTLVVVPLDAIIPFGNIVSVLFVTGLILLALRRAHAHMALRNAALGTCGIAILGSVVLQLQGAGSDLVRAVGIAMSALYALLFLMVWPAIIRRALSHRKISLNTVAAAVSAYLIIGLFFASLYRFMSLVDLTPFFAQNARPQFFDFEYFSFVTLTTVGYGDLSPVTNAGRSAAVFEALTGQIVLVTMVASLVSNLGRER